MGVEVHIVEPGDLLSRDETWLKWLEGLGVIPRQTYRVVNVDDDVAVIYRFALNEEGSKYVIRSEEDPNPNNDAVGDAATLPPMAVTVQDPMPTLEQVLEHKGGSDDPVRNNL